MGVQALQTAGPRLAADPARKLRPQPTLLLVGRLEAGAELRIFARGVAPTLDASRGLDPRDRRHQVRTRQPVGRRKRLSRIVVRCLLGYGRASERAADGHLAERTRRAAELALDDLAVIHPG